MSSSPTDPNAPKKTGRRPGKSRAEIEAEQAADAAQIAKTLENLMATFELDDFGDEDFSEDDFSEAEEEIKASKLPTPLHHAQLIAIIAWRELKPKLRAELAKDALAVSADCADAYVLLSLNANEPSRKRKLLEQALAAGERAIGAERFEKLRGKFWRILDTRPYMRALDELATVCASSGDLPGAIDCWTRMTTLDVSDALEARHLLATHLLIKGGAASHAALRRLFGRFPDDASAAFTYSRALLLFVERRGPSEPANRALMDAFTSNGYVADLMFESERMPEDLRDDGDPGGIDEADEYLQYARDLWDRTNGALEWMESLWLTFKPNVRKRR